MRKMRNLIILSILLIVLSPFLYGSGESERISQFAGHYVYLGEGNELLMNVQVWGQVKNPGLYSLPENSDIVTLLSLANGPTENADLSKIKVIRKGATKDSLYTVNLKKSLLHGEKEKITLKPGDIIEISPSTFYSISNFIRFITQVSMVVAVYYQIFGK